MSNCDMTGIKKAVSEANRCACDRWAIVLNTEDRTVREVEAIGTDNFPVFNGDVIIMSGRSIYGDRASIAEVVLEATKTLAIIDKATEEYKRGLRHTWKIEAHNEAVALGLENADDEFETQDEFVRDCISAAAM